MSNDRLAHIRKFYTILSRLEDRLGGSRKLGNCNGRQTWPKRGIYFFYEEGESRSDSGTGSRVVRIGTHALKTGSKSTLWQRLSQHRGTTDGGGNHRSSIFRLIVGTSLSAMHGQFSPTWNRAKVTTEERILERRLEIAVSKVIGNMSVLWLPIGDEPGPNSMRGYIEQNTIALLSNFKKHPIDASSGNWLGGHCDRTKVRESDLWNSNHVDDAYQPSYLRKLAHLVDQVK